MSGARGRSFVVVGPAVFTSMKLILLFDAPAALVSVSFPSDTVTVCVDSTQRELLDGVPLRASWFSRLNLKTLL
jgi:hypothetical protein